MTIEGGDSISQGLEQLNARVREAAVRQLRIEAELILDDAVRVVPIEEGMLQNSGRVAVAGTEAVIGFGSGPSAAYAVKQHEDTSLSHDAGRQAKYLEQPWLAARDSFMEGMAQAIRSVM